MAPLGKSGTDLKTTEAFVRGPCAGRDIGTDADKSAIDRQVAERAGLSIFDWGVCCPFLGCIKPRDFGACKQKNMTPPLDTPLVGGLKTRLFEGPESIGSLWKVQK